MHEIDKRIALIRLLLAEVEGRLQQQKENLHQYRAQIGRIVEVTVGQAGDVGQALAAMAEVEERALQVEITGRHLNQLRERAGRELEALLLTKRVAEATAQLAELEVRRAELDARLAALDAPADTAPAPDATDAAALRTSNAEVSREIERLHRLISETSQRAARSISPGG